MEKCRWESKNIAFDPQLVESADVKPVTNKSLYLFFKNPRISGPVQFKVILFKGQLYITKCGQNLIAIFSSTVSKPGFVISATQDCVLTLFLTPVSVPYAVSIICFIAMLPRDG